MVEEILRHQMLVAAPYNACHKKEQAEQKAAQCTDWRGEGALGSLRLVLEEKL